MCGKPEDNSPPFTQDYELREEQGRWLFEPDRPATGAVPKPVYRCRPLRQPPRVTAE